MSSNSFTNIRTIKKVCLVTVSSSYYIMMNRNKCVSNFNTVGITYDINVNAKSAELGPLQITNVCTLRILLQYP